MSNRYTSTAIISYSDDGATEDHVENRTVRECGVPPVEPSNFPKIANPTLALRRSALLDLPREPHTLGATISSLRYTEEWHRGILERMAKLQRVEAVSMISPGVMASLIIEEKSARSWRDELLKRFGRRSSKRAKTSRDTSQEDTIQKDASQKELDDGNLGNKLRHYTEKSRSVYHNRSSTHSLV